jgi:hypothetical protein
LRPHQAQDHAECHERNGGSYFDQGSAHGEASERGKVRELLLSHKSQKPQNAQNFNGVTFVTARAKWPHEKTSPM